MGNARMKGTGLLYKKINIKVESNLLNHKITKALWGCLKENFTVPPLFFNNSLVLLIKIQSGLVPV